MRAPGLMLAFALAVPASARADHPGPDEESLPREWERPRDHADRKPARALVRKPVRKASPRLETVMKAALTKAATRSARTR
jgi:hypothetical protein